MSRISQRLRGALALAALGLVASCDTKEPLGPTTGDAADGGLFSSYVAIGNSVTAGFQSDGITATGQAESYANLLARAMGTRFVTPFINGGDGCRPIVNFTTQARATTPAAGVPCARINISDLVNNVGVPGARAADPTSPSTPQSNGLTQLFLGGKTQVQRALDAKPTFSTVFIGNNDILSMAIGGLSTLPGVAQPTAQTAFETSYAKMLDELEAGAPELKGVLIGVLNVANLPILFSANAARANAAFIGGLSAATGRAVSFDPATCTAGTATLIAFPIVAQIRNDPTFSSIIRCEKGTTADPRVGDLFVLDATEQGQAAAIVSGYNNFIKTKAEAAPLGWAYLDPNVLFDSIKTASPANIPALPNLSSATAAYGPFFSLDGVHPNAAAHKLLANKLIAIINAKYSTSLKRI
jgi:lysophospholipase L1-like esterase